MEPRAKVVDPHPCDTCGGPWGLLSPEQRYVCGCRPDKHPIRLCPPCLRAHDSAHLWDTQRVKLGLPISAIL